MKTIKIRFIKKGAFYTVQRKTFFGRWRFIKYSTQHGLEPCEEQSKDKLLDRVIDEYYKTSKHHLNIVEHSTIKIH